MKTTASPPDELPTATAVSTVLPRRSAPVVTPTRTLLQSSVMAYFQQRHEPPVQVAMHPLRLLTLPSSAWPGYRIPGLGTIALRSLNLVEYQGYRGDTTDMMLCEG